jgi:glucose/mannose-6-phosphate isomerase
MMRDAILSFAEQFRFEPTVVNRERLGEYDGFVLAGMGGSHLAADLVKTWDPTFPISVHADYELPEPIDQDDLVIASSYSGNTEETLDAYRTAREAGLDVAVIATGGKLLEMATRDGMSFVQLPATGIQPRSALGYALRALLAIVGRTDALVATAKLADALRPAEIEEAGRELAKDLDGRVPVIYASSRNTALAYNWKIKFNETGKIPAFMNVLPELNHNEMTGFDAQPSSRKLSDPFHFLFLHDDADHPRVQKRMETLERLYADRGLPFTPIHMYEDDAWEKIFGSLLLADWTALATAEQLGLESEAVPMVEEFKRLIA